MVEHVRAIKSQRKDSNTQKTTSTPASQHNEQQPFPEQTALNNLTPDDILQLQRQIGNQAVRKMLRPAQNPNQPLASTTNTPQGKNAIQRIFGWGKKKNKEKQSLLGDKSGNSQGYSDEFETNELGDDGTLSSVTNLGLTGNSVRGGINSGVHLDEKVQEINIKEATRDKLKTEVAALKKSIEVNPKKIDDSAASTMVKNSEGVKKTLSAGDVLSSVTGFAAIGYGIYDTHAKYNQWKAFKTSAKDTTSWVANNKKKTSVKSPLLIKNTKQDQVNKVSKYGAAKSFRGFLNKLFNLIMSIGQFIANMIALLSGGTLAAFSGIAKLAIGLVTAAKTAISKVKGFFKWITGTRGKARMANANILVDKALSGNEEALKLILKLDLFGFVWMRTIRARLGISKIPLANDTMKKLKMRVKASKKQKKILVKTPENITDLLTYLETADNVGLLTDVKSAVFGVMASQ